MFLAIFSTFLSSIAKVFFKKTTQYNIKTELNDLYGHIGAILGLILIFILSDLNFILHSYFDYILIFISFILFLCNIKINQYVVKREKISALIPYENLGKVLMVLAGAFILKEEISPISLVMFLGVVVAIVLFSIDLKHLSFSRNIILYCGAQLVSATGNIVMGFILIYNTPVDYYTVYTTMSFISMLILCGCMGLYGKKYNLDKGYYINRGLSSLAWISWIISILLIKELGLSITTLLSFLGIAISLITSYIVFKDIPTKKNIILTILILVLVGAGYAFK